MMWSLKEKLGSRFSPNLFGKQPTQTVTDEVYRELFENAADIVFTTDLSGHFLAGNKAVERILGYTVEQAKGLTWEKLVAPYNMDKARQMYERHAKGEQYISFELAAITANGEVKIFEIGSRPMHQGNRIRGFHGIARDITQRKQMEKQLQEARKEADQANRAKSTFLANMSHEIRTPINGILGFISLFAKTELNEKQKEYLAPIESSAKHLLKIINDILDLSKIEAGRFSIDHELFNLPDTITSTIALLKPLAKDKGLNLELNLDSALPKMVIGDGTRIGQVLSNLVNNSIKFTDAGVISIKVNVKETEQNISQVLFSVRDNGIGINAQDQKSLFEPFHQVESNTNRRYPGTGLGLTICKNLVEAMGGQIDVESKKGEYTYIDFKIPLAIAPKSMSGETNEYTNPEDVFRGKGLSVLVVDDNEINRRFLGALLERHEINSIGAESGIQALELCNQQAFNLIFMDIHMADMDGFETTRRIRAQSPHNRYIPVVAVSADVIGQSSQRFIDQGLDDFLAKPVNERALIHKLRDIFPERSVVNTCLQPEQSDKEYVVLNRDKGIALAGNDVVLWKQSVDLVRSNLPSDIDQLEYYSQDKDWKNLKQAAHKLVGSTSYIGAEIFEKLCRDLQSATLEPYEENISKILLELKDAARQLLAESID